ncbi:MAG: hypothetical protein ABIP42_10650 [Planctomycetota bacterium]
MTTPPDLPFFAPIEQTHGVAGKVSRADVVRIARSWLDTPYQHQQRMKGVGVDCAGLVIGVARELGIVAADFDVTGYPQTPDGKSLLLLCDRFMRRVYPSEVQPGDVLVYQFHPKLGPQHMGILGDYLYGGLSLIQALGMSDGKGRVVEWNLDRPRKGWTPIQGYAMPGVA